MGWMILVLSLLWCSVVLPIFFYYEYLSHSNPWKAWEMVLTLFGSLLIAFVTASMFPCSVFLLQLFWSWHHIIFQFCSFPSLVIFSPHIIFFQFCFDPSLVTIITYIIIFQCCPSCCPSCFKYFQKREEEADFSLKQEEETDSASLESSESASVNTKINN